MPKIIENEIVNRNRRGVKKLKDLMESEDDQIQTGGKRKRTIRFNDLYKDDSEEDKQLEETVTKLNDEVEQDKRDVQRRVKDEGQKRRIKMLQKELRERQQSDNLIDISPQQPQIRSSIIINRIDQNKVPSKTSPASSLKAQQHTSSQASSNKAQQHTAPITNSRASNIHSKDSILNNSLNQNVSSNLSLGEMHNSIQHKVSEFK